MELNYLRNFYEVAKSGSFTEAARRLHTSQSALSKSVALLEHREGVKLLHRSKKGVTLTEIGREVFAQSERLFELADQIEATCKGRSEICEGPLSFGASDHVVNYMLLPALKAFQNDHPKVLPRIFTGTPNDSIQLLINKEIDFGLFFTRMNVPSIKYEALTEVEMVAVCHPSFQDKHSRTNLKSVLGRQGLIGSIRSQYQSHPSSGLIHQGGKGLFISCEVNSQETQKRYCLMGGGVAYLARFMVESEIADGRLVEITIKKAERLPLFLARRLDRELPITARTFLHQLGDQLA